MREKDRERREPSPVTVRDDLVVPPPRRETDCISREQQHSCPCRPPVQEGKDR
jgi:hypothetical protein